MRFFEARSEENRRYTGSMAAISRAASDGQGPGQSYRRDLGEDGKTHHTTGPSRQGGRRQRGGRRLGHESGGEHDRCRGAISPWPAATASSSRGTQRHEPSYATRSEKPRQTTAGGPAGRRNRLATKGAWPPERRKLWTGVGKACGWGHPRVSTIRTRFNKEKAAPAVPRWDSWSLSRRWGGVRGRELEDLAEAEGPGPL